MRKNMVSTLCAAIMAISAAVVPISESGVVFAPAISASAEVYGDFQYFRHFDGTIKIYRYNGTDSEVVIPSELDGTVVTLIDKNAFKDNTYVKKVTLPENCTTIEENAFSGCTSLESVVVPSTLTHILGSSFYGCTSLKDIQLEHVQVIWKSAFSGCSSLENVTLNEKLGALEESAFEGCSSLKSIVLPATLTAIEPYTFKGCTSLENVTIPDGIKRLESSCFMGCTSLRSIFLPKSIRYIEPDAFIDCTSLVSIDGRSNGSYFYESGLVYDFATRGYGLYIFPEGAESLYSFKGYFEVPSFALRHCPKLRNIYLYTCNDNLSLNNGILYTNNLTELIRCPETKTAYSALTLPAECKKIRQYGMSRVKISTVILPDGLTELEDEAFLDSKALTTILIPDSVTTFGNNVFGGCTDLVIMCNEGSAAEQYAKDNNIEYGFDRPHSHSYTGRITRAATCTTDGVETYTCSCGDSYTEGIPALGHDISSEWTIDSAPTCTAPGCKSHHCSRCNVRRDITDIPATGHKFVYKTITPTYDNQGYTQHTCSVCGYSYKDNYKPKKQRTDISKAAVSVAANGVYTGKALTPSVTVELGGKMLAKNTDYTVAYKNNVNCGQATVTVTGKGAYTGSKTASFIIKPGKVAAKKLTSPKKKTVKLTWNKSGGGVSGYEVQIALNKKFTKSAKTYDVKATAASKTVKGLKKGKKYFARVRAYKTLGKTKYYGAWSAVKSVKCK